MACPLILSTLLMLCLMETSAFVLPDSLELRNLLSRYEEEIQDQDQAKTRPVNRTRRAIRWSDREEIIQLHNKLRSGVYPTAANMEHMVWDEELERSATHWAEQCQWDHGPRDLLRSIGQNLGVHWGQYRAPAFHVQAWYNEVKDYTYPYPHECSPWCPDRCSGPMCTHYTQLVWATTSRVGCAVHVCPQMDVWGEVWRNAVYLVCNYSPKGNWIGEAPYKHGRPCSQCPPSYGGGCRNNLCYKDSETEDMNEVEKPSLPVAPRSTPKPTVKPKPAPKKPAPRPKPPKTSTTKTPLSTAPANTFLTHNIKCETRLRDKCRGLTCNRFKCPANCLSKKGKVYGTLFYDVQSSICLAAIHFGVIDNNGGIIDVTRMEKFPFFVKSTKNGVQSLSKYKPGNAFVMAKVQEISVDCYTTVAEICPYKKPNTHCPRISCPPECKSQPSYWSPVIGNNIYADNSSICKAAIHAGAIRPDGGLVDVIPLDKRKSYTGILKNGIQSESKSSTDGGSFRVFIVRQ